MVGLDAPGEDRLMDEPTLDCVICGDPATLEVVDQVLTDEAEWRTRYRFLVCDEHRSHVRIWSGMLEQHQRVILQTCG